MRWSEPAPPTVAGSRCCWRPLCATHWASRIPAPSSRSWSWCLVDDQPGVREDRAHYEANAGEQRVRVVLTRDEQGWRGQTAT